MDLVKTLNYYNTANASRRLVSGKRDGLRLLDGVSMHFFS